MYLLKVRICTFRVLPAVIRFSSTIITSTSSMNVHVVSIGGAAAQG